MTYLRLFWEFFKTGLFAVGGGMATVPFLKNIGLATGWYSQTDLMNMLAVSESTPGPIGINMATYVGFTVAGITAGAAGCEGQSVVLLASVPRSPKCGQSAQPDAGTAHLAADPPSAANQPWCQRHLGHHSVSTAALRAA